MYKKADRRRSSMRDKLVLDLGKIEIGDHIEVAAAHAPDARAAMYYINRTRPRKFVSRALDSKVRIIRYE